MMTLANRVAIISGSGRGIGREIARLFSSVGARIVVADIDAESARAAAAEINAAGNVARAIAVDIGDPAQVERLIEDTLAHFGRVDVLVNNAGVGLNKPFLDDHPGRVGAPVTGEPDRDISLRPGGRAGDGRARGRGRSSTWHRSRVSVAARAGRPMERPRRA